MSLHNTRHQIFHCCLFSFGEGWKRICWLLVASEMRTKWLVLELVEILDQFKLEQVQVGKFLSIQSVFGEVSSLFQDLTMTLSGWFRESITERLVASSDRECSLLVGYSSITDLVVWLRHCLGQIWRTRTIAVGAIFRFDQRSWRCNSRWVE